MQFALLNKILNTLYPAVSFLQIARSFFKTPDLSVEIAAAKKLFL